MKGLFIIVLLFLIFAVPVNVRAQDDTDVMPDLHEFQLGVIGGWRCTDDFRGVHIALDTPWSVDWDKYGARAWFLAGDLEHPIIIVFYYPDGRIYAYISYEHNGVIDDEGSPGEVLPLSGDLCDMRDLFVD